MPVVRLLLLAGIMAHKARMSAPGLGRAKKIKYASQNGTRERCARGQCPLQWWMGQIYELVGIK